MTVPHCSYVDSSYPCKRDSHFWVEAEVYDESEIAGGWTAEVSDPSRKPTSRTACQIHVGEVLKEQTHTVDFHAHFYVTPVDCV